MAYSQAQLSDIESIRDATKHYSRGVDRLDADIMKLAYWPEATDEHGVFNGNAWEFCDFCMEGHLGWRSTMHCIFNHSIELDSDGIHARGELYNVTYLFRADTPILDTWYGRYLDEYEKRGDEWRIIKRVCVHEGTTSGESPKMELDTEGFRQGSFDRPSSKRSVGP
ncbi:MAG: nuclear transport factor 2 family protein [Halioglobus sp.]